jgi:RNA polymerase sigma factor (sigma-70 family)
MARETFRSAGWFDLISTPEQEDPDVALQDRVAAAVEQLPRDERTVVQELWLYTSDERNGPQNRPGKAVAQVAREMGISLNTVRRLERTALARLRTLLEEE